MKQIFRIYFKAEDTRPFLVLFCLLIGGVAEAASISTLLPAITSISGGDVAGSSYLNAQIRSVVSALGMTPDLGNLILLIVGLMVFKSTVSFGASVLCRSIRGAGFQCASPEIDCSNF